MFAQAELAARDLMRLSRPGSKGATGTSATPEGSGFAWSFLSHLSAMVLNRLQMTISNVHICFQVSPLGPKEPQPFQATAFCTSQECPVVTC